MVRRRIIVRKILVTYQIPKEGLASLFSDYNVIYPDKRVLTKEEILSLVPEVDGILAAGVKIDAEIIEQAKNLKIISGYGAGYDNIDIKSATAKGITVTNTPDAVTEATAEIAFGLMLGVMRRIAECDRKLRVGVLKWGMMNNLGHVLYGKVLGIIGMGRIGKAIARRGLASGMQIIYHNRNRLDEETESTYHAKYRSLKELLQEADVVSISTPLTKETYHLIGKEELELMKPSAYLINTSRGAVLDEAALIKILQAKKIAGAGLDVFEQEPYIPPELLAMDHVVLGPHIGTEAIEARVQMAMTAAENICNYFAGITPKYVVNKEQFKGSLKN